MWVSSVPFEVTRGFWKTEVPKVEDFSTMDLVQLIRAPNQKNHNKVFYFDPKKYPMTTEGKDKLFQDIMIASAKQGCALMRNGTRNECIYLQCCLCRKYQQTKKREGAKSRKSESHRSTTIGCPFRIHIRLNDHGWHLYVQCRNKGYHECDRASLAHSKGVQRILFSARPIITVFGATGSQGASVVKALLGLGTFSVRAATRKKHSSKAKALRDAGCEVVQASYEDVESLENALKGSYGAWFVTSFWDSGIGAVEAEVANGRRVAEAAKKCNIKHLVYSTLESPAATFGDSFPTFDAKIGVEQEILYAGVLFTFLQVAWSYTNLANKIKNTHDAWFDWRRDENGAYILRIPIGPNGLHGCYSGDVGPVSAKIFANREEYAGRKIALSGELLTPETIVRDFSEAFPDLEFRFVNPALEDYKGMSAGYNDPLSKMYGFYAKRMPRGGDLELTKKLHPEVKTLAMYLRDCKEDFDFEKESKPCIN